MHDVDDLDTMETTAEAGQRRRAGPAETWRGWQADGAVPAGAMNEEHYRRNMIAGAMQSPMVAFRNLGNLKFEEVGPPWGLNQPAFHNGIALADLDNDGGLDIVVNNLGSVPSVYHNRGSAPRVAVRLKGRAPNTQGIGGKIKLLGGALPMQSQEAACGGFIFPGSDPLRVFAAGRSQSMTLEVTWRSGKKSVVRDVKPNRIYEIDETGPGGGKSAAGGGGGAVFQGCQSNAVAPAPSGVF